METIKNIYCYFKRYTLLIFLASISSLIVAASQGAIAYVVKPLMDGILLIRIKFFITYAYHRVSNFCY